MTGTLDQNQPLVPPAVGNSSNPDGPNTTGNQSHRPLSSRRAPGNPDSGGRTALPSQHAPRSALDAIKAIKKNHIPGLGRKFLWKVPHEVCIILSY